ncbi:MAG: PAS domain-containing protein [Cellvibrionaceae bacterium]
MSFRLKVTSVIIALCAGIMFSVLWLSISFLSEKMQAEIERSNENVMQQIKQFGVMEAVLVEDYGKLILDFQSMVEQLDLDEIFLCDIDSNILASSKPDQLGKKINLSQLDDHWRVESISSGLYVSAYLAYRFNSNSVVAAQKEAFSFGLMLIVISVLLMATVGYLAGRWLSLRLEKMVGSLSIITEGQIEKFTVDESKDEIGMLSRFVHTIGTKIALQKEELIDSEERMRLALQSAGAGAWKYDIKGASVFWTAKVYQIFGLMPSDKAPSMKLWSSFVHPEDLPLLTNALTKLFETGENLCVEYRIIRRSGVVRWVRSVGRLFMDENDEPVEAYGMLFDISHHKSDFSIMEAEKNLLSAVFNHSAECFIVVNIKKEIVAANKKAKEIFCIDEVIDPILMSTVFSSQTIAEIDSNNQRNITLILKDGTELAYEFVMNTFPYQDENLSDFIILSFYFN